MSQRTKNTIAKILDQAQLAINNTLADPEIQALMTAYGYTPAKMRDGQALQQKAVAIVQAQSAASGAQQTSTQLAQNAETDARVSYQGLARVARAVFVRDRSQLVTLGLAGPTPKTIPAFLTAAYTLFDNVAGNAVIKATLAGYGYDDGRLQSERAKISGYDALHQANEAAKGTAQQATQEQVSYMQRLSDWLAQFIKIARVALRDKPQLLEKLGILARSGKTAAQRGAPLKAAATRKAHHAVPHPIEPPVRVAPSVIQSPVLVPQPAAQQAAQAVQPKEGTKAA